ncbi:hypothetical protein JCM6882_000562 [Rhodosporidiobolus microsporus]
MEPPPRTQTPRQRPQSVYGVPSSPSSSFTFGRPTSPPPASPSSSPRLNRRPTHQGHRTTSSLSSLAQLNLNGAHSHAHSSGTSSPSQTPPLGPPPHSPSFANGGQRLERSNSILASPSTHWGGFGNFANPAVGGGGHGREYEDVQNRTFCKWLNARLEPHGYEPVTDLGHDFSDGTRLIQLVEVLTEISLGRYNRAPYHRVQKMENAKQALERIKEMGVHLTNIGPEDIVDGNRKLILGMIWSLVLRFSIADINEEGSHAKEGLLLWCQRRTAPYDEVDVKDFTRSWQDGLAFCALIHRHRPDLLDYDSLPKDASHASAASNLARAFRVAEESLGIPQLLDVEDVCGTKRPDERSVMTYVAQFFHAFSSRAQAETEARVISNFVENTSSLMLAVHDYERRVRALLSALDAHLSSLRPLPPSTPYATLFALRSSASDHRRMTRRAWHREKMDTAELLGNVREKLRTYGLRGYEPEEGVRVVDVQDKWDELTAAETARSKEINVLIRQIQQAARDHYAREANGLQTQVQAVQAELSSITGPLETQLDLLSTLRTSRLPPLRSALARLADAEETCRECDAFVDGVDETAVEGREEGEWEVRAVEEKVERRRAFVENQIVARKSTALSPEQLEEYESAFRAFDKDGKNVLDLDELAGALGSLGILEVNLDDIVQTNEQVSFDEFIRFMTARAEDRLTGEKVRSCFRSVAAEKGYVTELDLARLALPSTALSFLKQHMPSGVIPSASLHGDGEDGGGLPNGANGAGETTVFDFEEFLNQFLEESG